MTHLLILSSGHEMYRRYALESIRRQGVRITLLESPPMRTWALPLVDAVYEEDLADHDRIRAKVKELHAGSPFNGVLSYDETRVELAAAVSADLGLPGLSPESAARCRDKQLMREAFRWAGVPSAQSVLALTVEEAAAAAGMIGYPVVVKPRNLGGSRGVVLVENDTGLRAQFDIAAGARDPRIESVPGVLVEEYLDGPEVSVECVVQEGRVHLCGLTEKQVGFAPYFEELGHVCGPPKHHPQYQAIVRVVEEAHRALGVTFGATHSELRLTSTGPRMIEVAARLGGDLIPMVTRLATGVDQVALTVSALTGGTVGVEPTQDRVAGIRMLYPDRAGTVRRLDHIPGAEELWYDLQWHVSVGQEVALPPSTFMGRLGHVVAVADSLRELEERLDEAVAALVTDIEARPSVG